MKKAAILLLIFTLIINSCKQKLETKKEEIKTEEEISKDENMPKIEIIDEALNTVLNTDAIIEILTPETFGWSEGPVWVEEHQMVLFTDVPNNKVYKWSDANGLEVYLNPSGNTGIEEGAKEGANGLLLNAEGQLVLCQHGDRRVSIMDAPLDAPESKFIPIVTKYDGKKFSSPNDAAYHKNGDLYFTDPPYGLNDGFDESPRKQIDFNGVYKVDKEGKVTVIDKELTRPNGIAFSPDFLKLYVANSDPKNAIWKVYDVDVDGNTSNGKVFGDVTSLVGDDNPGLPDGLRVDDNGNLFATGPGGVFVISSEGTHLGTINTGKATANCTFNVDKSVLYMTVKDQLMRVKIK